MGRDSAAPIFLILIFDGWRVISAGLSSFSCLFRLALATGGQAVAGSGGLYPMVLCHNVSQALDQGQWVGRCRTGRRCGRVHTHHRRVSSFRRCAGRRRRRCCPRPRTSPRSAWPVSVPGSPSRTRSWVRRYTPSPREARPAPSARPNASPAPTRHTTRDCLRRTPLIPRRTSAKLAPEVPIRTGPDCCVRTPIIPVQRALSSFRHPTKPKSVRRSPYRPAICSSRRMRSSIGGCVENSDPIRSPARNGLAIIRCA
jgi:hypothetical protein